MDPPRYPRLSGDSGDSQLPRYSNSNTRLGQSQVLNTEHTFELIDSKVAWATLKIRSRAYSASHLPTFLEGDSISGSVALNLGSKEVHVMAVKVLVTGKLTASASAYGGSLTFLRVEKTLWSKDMGNPRQPSSSSAWRYSGKLSGSYEWPFALTLPTKSALPPNSTTSDSYRLPQTFLERHIPTSIQYDLYIFIERSKFRMDSNLHTMLAYIPATRPAPPSVLRQLSYQANTPIPGPDADPNGWHTPGPFVFQGRIFDYKQVLITGSLYVAKPPSYTRGTQLPLTLTLSCNDGQALDLLASPNVLRACLRRRIRGCKASATAPLPVPAFITQTRDTSQNSYIPGCVSIPDCVEDLETAVWWPSATNIPLSAVRSTTPIRVLQGEVNLPKTLKPSSCIDQFTIEYAIVLFHPVTPGFTPNLGSLPLSQKELPFPISEIPVEIATMHAPGPRSRSQIQRNVSPPRYSDSQPRGNGGSNYAIPPSRGYM